MTQKYLIAILLSSVAYGQIGLGMAPMRHELKLNAGGQSTGVLDLSNEGVRPMRVQAEFLDFSIDRNTTPQFAAALPSEQRWSCREWINLNPMAAEITEKGSLSARFTIRVPKEALPGTYHCAIGYSSVPTLSTGNSSAMVTRVRVISAFYILVGDYHPAGRVEGLTLERVPDAGGGHWVAVVTVANQGDYYFRAQGDVELLDEAGKVLQKAPVNSTAILPQRSQRILVPLASVVEARMNQLKVTMDLSQVGQEEVSAQVTPALP